MKALLKKVILVDNYDSFTHNIKYYLEQLNAKVTILEANENLLKKLECMDFTHLVISPGPKSPLDATFSNECIRKYYKKIPILGICLGHQCIAHVFNLEIIKINPSHGIKSSLKILDKSDIFKDVENAIVGRYHSLGVQAKDMHKDIKILATCTLKEDFCKAVNAKNGLENDVIMAIRHRVFPTYGIQFHPESVLTNCGFKVLENFLKQII